MSEDEYWTKVAALPAFQKGVLASAIRSTLSFFEVVHGQTEDSEPDWDRALMAASLVTIEAPERTQDGALRIVQGCLQDRGSSREQRSAAAYLLARLGNARASNLAKTKNLIPDDSEGFAGPLTLDLLRRTLELSVEVGGSRVQVNDFQRRFWTAAEESRWLSVSAPTSAGKSYIVRLWLEALIGTHERFRAVYVVPTRALIEEVSREFETELGASVTVTTMPWDSRIGELPHELFVLTQERLHILLRQRPAMTFDLIFVDEAQKLADGSRGVLLQRTLDEAVKRGEPQIIFASPLTANPEILIEGEAPDQASLLGETVTVNQTLLHVNQRPQHPRRWDMSLVLDGQRHAIGEFSLPARPVPDSKRLSLVAVALGKSHSGNVVYANRPSDAEKTASQIYDALDGDGWSANDDVRNVIELVEKTIHPQYLLAKYLKRGVAFHYGNMPLLVREAVERLFRDGAIRYLVCTSTLLEGVNLPCQNLFVRAPRKGNNTPMSASDFWNLAGRAGRWGVEFQGNVICLDTDREVWGEVPVRRTRQSIKRATDAVASDFDALIEYLDAETPAEVGRKRPLLQSLFGILASTRRRGDSVSGLPWMQLTAEQAEALEVKIDDALAKITLAPELLQTHAGISAFAIQRLHDMFREIGDRSQFDLPLPEASDAVNNYMRAIEICSAYLGADFTDSSGRHFRLAVLFVEWMRGRPVSLLIRSRLNWLRNHNRPINLPSDIRSVLNDVEQYARFEGPLYLSCYADVLNAALPLAEDDEPSIDVAMMMEIGVSRTTEVSMSSLGISRTSVVALAEHIVSDDLSPAECLTWLESQDLEGLGLPSLVVAEIQAAVTRAKSRGQRGR